VETSGSSIIGLLLPIVALAGLGVWIWAIVDMARYPDFAWDISGQRRGLWILLAIFFPLIGLILYFAVARPKLKSSVPRLSGRGVNR